MWLQLSPSDSKHWETEMRPSLPGGERDGDADVPCGAALCWRGPGNRVLLLPESSCSSAPQARKGQRSLPPPAKFTLVWKELGASRRGKFHPGAACFPPKAGLSGAVTPWGGRAGRRAPAVAQPQGSTATVNARSDFPCLRLLVLAAEPPQEQPDWGRLENNPPTASTAGVNVSGLLLP